MHFRNSETAQGSLKYSRNKWLLNMSSTQRFGQLFHNQGKLKQHARHVVLYKFVVVIIIIIIINYCYYYYHYSVEDAIWQRVLAATLPPLWKKGYGFLHLWMCSSAPPHPPPHRWPQISWYLMENVLGVSDNVMLRIFMPCRILFWICVAWHSSPIAAVIWCIK